MNVLLYYPRLFAALVWQPLPKDHATFCHWVYAQFFQLWNQPWRDASDTLGMQCLQILRKEYAPLDPSCLKTRWASFMLRYIYLLLLVVWPMAAMCLSIRQGRRFLIYWNSLVNNFILYLQRRSAYEKQNPKGLSGLSFYLPLLYIRAKTGWRLPDYKDEIYEQCSKWRLPAPRVYTKTDGPLPPGRYFVKPVDGYAARGALITTDPAQYLEDPKFVVQDAVRNVRELRNFWGTDALGTMRFVTLQTQVDRYEVMGCLLRIPAGNSIVDNYSHGNAGTPVARDGTMGRLYWKGSPKEGAACHPTTGIMMEGMTVPQYRECEDLARRAHQRIAPNAPFFNADIAVTEQGPMIIEYNNAPGVFRAVFENGAADRFVDSFCRAIAQASRRQPSKASELQPSTA